MKRAAPAYDPLKCMPVLELRNVSKVYATDGEPVSALRNVSLEVVPGQFVALTGPSGCGKSTLLNLCGAVDFPTEGDLLIDGVSTRSLDDRGLTRLRRQKVGFVFQSFQLLQTLSAVENVELPLLLAHSPAARRAATQKLEWVGLADLANRLPHQLSGGQQQRVAIARALAHNPGLILADEPTGNLDTATGESVLELLRRLASDFRTAIVMATHNPESAAIVDRVIRMRDGRIVE